MPATAAEPKTRQIESGVLYRSFQIDRAAVGSDEDRTVELSFSSEAPIEQYNWDYGRYLEVLDHSPDSVDMSRLAARAPLLLEHQRACQIGVIESASIADRKGVAKVRFGKGEKADEIFRDVKDGIRSLVSVGYRVTKLVVEKIEETGLDTLRAMGWQPMEVSIVSVPADFSVGVGRSERSDGNKVTLTIPITMKRFNILRDPDPADRGGGTPPAPTPTTPSATPATAPVPAVPTLSAREQQSEMFNIASAHGMMDLYGRALTEGTPLVEFQKEVLKKIFENSRAQVKQQLTPTSPQGKRTLGELLTQSEQYKNAIKVGGGAHRGVSLEIPNLSFEQVRATLLTTTGLTSYDRPPGIITLGQQPLAIAQLFAQGTTSAATIRITQEVSFTNAATAVAEEGQKPEATFDLAEVDFGVKKIAVIGRVSDEMFADFPQVQAYVNSRLIYMVGAKEDNDLINGDNNPTSELTGILATSGIQTVAAGASQTVIDAIFKAMVKVASIGFFQPDYIVVNHTDWQNIRLTKDQNGQYLAGGPFTGSYGVGGYTVAGMLWGLPVVATNAIAQGTALVGAFQLGAQLFRREGIRLDTTNSDASDFVYNRIAIRVETRLALPVYRPLAFCTVTGIPAV